jgi:CRP/FNR family transcriptional regulator, cyclic AMP receptor protein
MARNAKAKFDARAFLARAHGGVTVSNYRKDQLVFSQGDPADSIFFIQEGKVKVTVVSHQGKEAVIAFLEAGDFIGEGCLTGRPRRISHARALLDSATSRTSPSYSRPISWRAPSELKKTWSTNCSIQARSA